MDFVLDADAIIKLNRAGALEAAASSLDCTIPAAVYEEVVLQGKARGYVDALVIESTIMGGTIAVVEVDVQDESREALGPGEKAILQLVRDDPQLIAVSDDRPFLNALSREGLPYLTPAGIIVLMAGQSILSQGDAKVALERLRPAIRQDVYSQAVRELTRLEHGSDE